MHLCDINCEAWFEIWCFSLPLLRRDIVSIETVLTLTGFEAVLHSTDCSHSPTLVLSHSFFSCVCSEYSVNPNFLDYSSVCG